MALTTRQIFDVNGWDAIEERSNHEDIKAIISQNVQTYYTINVDDAMKKLVQVGQLLQLAYSGSKGFPCSTQVLEVLCNYQDLVKDSVITSSTFVSVALKSLSYHKTALLLAEKGKGGKSLEILTKCGSLAGQMAVESEKLVTKSDDLIKLSVTALLETNKNYNGSEKMKRQIIERARKLEEGLVNKQSKARGLESAVEDARLEAEKEAADAKGKETIVAVAGILGPIGNVIAEKTGKLAENARLREAKARELRRKLQEEERNVNADLAETVKRLQNSNVEKDELDKSIDSLEVTIQTMGKVKTVFAKSKQFWVGVQKHCETLTCNEQAKILADPDVFEDLKDEFIEEIKKSGLGWLALGKINRQAALAMRKADETVDDVMTNLPKKEEVEALVQKLTATILGDIAKENEMIKANMDE